MKVPVAGLYSSALERAEPLLLPPPAIITIPLLSNVAEWRERAAFRLPVALKVPVVALYCSALERVALLVLVPPATRTIPLFSNVAV
jgi:hypothetical protein